MTFSRNTGGATRGFGYLAEQTLRGVGQDVRQRYAGSYLGVAWSFVYPLALLTLYAAVYAFIFKVRVAGLDTKGYIVLISAGLMPVIAFSEILSFSAGSLEQHRALLLRSETPSWLIPVRSVLAGQVNTAFGLVIAMVGAIATGRIYPTFALAPVIWMLFLAFMIGLAWFISLFAIRFRDVYPAIGIIGISALIISPATYSPAMVPDNLKSLLFCNPLTPFIQALQYCICYGKLPPASIWVWCIGWTSVSLVGGFVYFRRMKRYSFDLL